MSRKQVILAYTLGLFPEADGIRGINQTRRSTSFGNTARIWRSYKRAFWITRGRSRSSENWS